MSNVNDRNPLPLSVPRDADAQAIERNDVKAKRALTEANNERRASERGETGAAPQTASGAKGIESLAQTDTVTQAAPPAPAPLVMLAPLQASEIGALQTPEQQAELAALFSDLELGKPSGVEIGNPLKTWAPALEDGAALPSLTFSSAGFVKALEIAASAQAKGGAQSTSVERATAFVHLLQNEASAGQAAFARLSPAQQAAIAQVVQKIPAVELRQALLEGARLGADGKPIASGLRRDQRVNAVPQDAHDEQALLLGEAPQELLSSGAEAEGALGSLSAVFFLSEGAQVGTAEADAARLAAGEVVLPSPVMTRLESAGLEGLGGALFAGMDIMALCQIVLAQCAAGSEQDLREVMNEMKESNQKNDALRAQMAKQRDQQAQIESALRDRYHQRTVMTDPEDPMYINPETTNFEAYKVLQKIEQQGSDDAPIYRLSPNEPRFPRTPEEIRDLNGSVINQRDVDLANMASVTPQAMAALRRTFNDPDCPDDWAAKYNGDFELFLAQEVGLETPAPAGANQNRRISEWRDAHDPVAINAHLAERFGVSVDQIAALAEHRERAVAPDEQGVSLEAWLEETVGLSAGAGAENLAAIENFHAGVAEVEAQRAESAADAQLCRDFGVSVEDIAQLKAFLSLRDGVDATTETVRAFMTRGTRETPPGLGFRKGASHTEGNRRSLGDWKAETIADLRARDARRSLPEGYETLEAALAAFVSPDQVAVEKVEELMDAFFAGLEPASARTAIVGQVNELIAKIRAQAPQDQIDAASQGLKSFIDALPADQRQPFYNYVALRLAQLCGQLGLEGAMRSSLTTALFASLGSNVPLPGGAGQTPVDDAEVSPLEGRTATLLTTWAASASGTPDEPAASELLAILDPPPPPPAPPPAPAPVEPVSINPVVMDAILGAVLPLLQPATLLAAMGQPTQAQRDNAERFKVQIDHTTEQGEHFEVKEVTLAQIGADLETLKDRKDSQSAFGEMVGLRLQMYMDRRQKLLEVMSNTLKKSADTQSGIISNMK